MQVKPEAFLLPEDDGLEAYEKENHTLYKLAALETYLAITDKAMHNKWKVRFFIDLFSGSGKNHISGETYLGSPLIALTSEFPATHFRFNETNAGRHDALSRRVQASPIRDRVQIARKDANEVVDDIARELDALHTGGSQTLNIAFLDPEGLDLRWDTIVKLAKFPRMDLILYFPSGFLLRTIGTGYTESVDALFGTRDWRSVIDPSNSAGDRRRNLIEFYLNRLKQYGYFIEIDPDFHFTSVIQVTNRRNVEMYSLIFASKHELGQKFWNTSAKSVKPPRLPGF